MRQVFPFTAILGQDEMKNALLWNAINPRIGGVLLSGQKGTAKSTVARGLADLMGGMKIVELPLNITEDRLIGSIDLKAAIREGTRSFEPGILAAADGNILYIDEVNLLSDFIINSLLESAASGKANVEREGISYSYRSNFVLVGSMNPEEGKLRPQFLDRFGLYVEIRGEQNPNDRAEIIKRRISYERDSAAFMKRWEADQEKLASRIAIAAKNLEKIEASENAMKLASSLSARSNCAGHRAEICIIEAAKAIAALDGRIMLNTEDIQTAALYALPHRVRDNAHYVQEEDPPMEEMEEPKELEDQEGPEDPPPPPPEEMPEEDEQVDDQDDEDSQDDAEEIDNQPLPPDLPPPPPVDDEDVQEIGETFDVFPWISESVVRSINKGSGRRNVLKTTSGQGRYVRAAFPKGKTTDLAFDATIRAAAVHQKTREKNGMAIAVRNSDFREKIREKRTGNTIIFAVDASGSMGANQRMRAVKGAICSLLNDSYQKRDKVGMIAFRHDSAETLLSITRSVELAQKRLAELPTGGRTPMAKGLELALDTILVERLKDKDILPVLVLVTDGRANSSDKTAKPMEEVYALANQIAIRGIKSVVVDTENDFIRLGLAEKIAEAMCADYYRIEDLNAEHLVQIVSGSVRSA
ncbi:MAG: AAA family ATPase [Eubacteriaceae bacterium]|nr:AAA family ATPase [Eubacteriaceae bacterium]